MSEKAEKKEAPKKDEKGGEEKKGGGLLTKTPVLLGGVMAIQAVIVLAGVKLLMPAPAPAAAAVAVEGEEHAGAASEGAATEDAHGGGDTKADAHGGGDAKAGAKSEAKAYDPKKQYEIKLIEIKAPNKLSGRTFLYDMQIVVLVKGKVAKELEKTISEREALIRDRIRTIIAQSDPEKLGGGSEPGLETLRRQVKYQLDEIIDDGKGESKIDEVLIPRCIPYRTDF
jgi:flagellar basal body-associated protein FliL